MTKQQAIATMFLTNLREKAGQNGEACGIDVRGAFDRTFGEGAYERFAGDLYDMLLAQAMTR